METYIQNSIHVSDLESLTTRTTADATECNALDAFLSERIYAFNVAATGYSDAKMIGGVMKNNAGETIAGFNGHSWGACCVISPLWVHDAYRGRGFGRALLHGAEAEAARRGCEQIVLSTHSFQASHFYERLGYNQAAVVDSWPRGHSEIFYRKIVTTASSDLERSA